MSLDAGTMLAIMIALASSVTVMCLFWKENIALQRQIKVLLHEEKNNG
jgi:undecaprenyl pyrophosphate phosphatase UppP